MAIAAAARILALRVVAIVFSLVLAMPVPADTHIAASEHVATSKTKLFNYDFEPELLVPRGEREQRVRDRLVEPEPIFARLVLQVTRIADRPLEPVPFARGEQDAASRALRPPPRRSPESPRAPPSAMI